MIQNSIYFRHHVYAINLQYRYYLIIRDQYSVTVLNSFTVIITVFFTYQHRDVAPVPQGHVEDRPVLGEVDPLPGEHGLPRLLHSSLAS